MQNTDFYCLKRTGIETRLHLYLCSSPTHRHVVWCGCIHPALLRYNFPLASHFYSVLWRGKHRVFHSWSHVRLKEEIRSHFNRCFCLRRLHNGLCFTRVIRNSKCIFYTKFSVLCAQLQWLCSGSWVLQNVGDLHSMLCLNASFVDDTARLTWRVSCVDIDPD